MFEVENYKIIIKIDIMVCFFYDLGLGILMLICFYIIISDIL